MKTFQGCLYLGPEGIKDQTGTLVLSKDELLKELGVIRSEAARSSIIEECAALLEQQALKASSGLAGPWGMCVADEIRKLKHSRSTSPQNTKEG